MGSTRSARVRPRSPEPLPAAAALARNRKSTPGARMTPCSAARTTSPSHIPAGCRPPYISPAAPPGSRAAASSSAPARLADVEIARPGAAPPLVGTPLRDVVLERIDAREAALLQRLHLLIHRALLRVQRLQLPAAVVDDPDG